MAVRPSSAIACCLATGIIFGMWAVTPCKAWAYTPKSPEVRAIVDSALAYLEDKGGHSRVGGKSLVGMAFLKNGAGPDHPRVASAIAACQKFAETVPTATGDRAYDAGLALIFLCEHNPTAYRAEITNLVRYFVATQKEHGGYGYADRDTGDNSMTQYAALGLWLAHQNGFDVPPETVGKLTNWIVAVQDPSGGFGYQGVVAPQGKGRVDQSSIRLSLTTAGLCSLYVSADALGLSNRRLRAELELPPELEEVTPDSPRLMSAGAKLVDAKKLRETKKLGNQWLEENFAIDGGQWQFYYLYALERYKAFQELDLGRPDAATPWYDEGVEFIRKKQQEDGAIRGTSEEAPISTAFSVLFLVRGTSETIKKHARTFDTGLLAGGRGLPDDLSQAELRNGKVVDATEVPDTERFMELLEADDGGLDELVDADVTFDWQAAEDRPAALEAIRQKLRRGSYAARRMAVRAIRESRDFDSVPALIYALSDPDPRIVQEARDALRFISRKIDGFGLPLNPSRAEVEAASEKWKAWYVSLRPDARFWE